MLKQRRLIFVFIIIFTVLVSLGGFLKSKYVIPIIMYHSVELEASPVNPLIVSASDFEKQMAFLKKFKYNVVPLEEVGNLIRNKKKAPPRTIAITFDDGYRDNYVYAFPALKKYGLPATIFVIYEQIATGGKLGWGDIQEMQDSGLITFGSHTLNHRALVEYSDMAEMKRQVFESKKVLEEKLKRPVNIFSYPIGAFNANVRQTVIEAGYKMAVATSPKKYPNNDLFALKRIRISPKSGNLLVYAIQTSGLYNFVKDNRDGR